MSLSGNPNWSGVDAVMIQSKADGRITVVCTDCFAVYSAKCGARQGGACRCEWFDISAEYPDSSPTVKGRESCAWCEKPLERITVV